MTVNDFLLIAGLLLLLWPSAVLWHETKGKTEWGSYPGVQFFRKLFLIALLACSWWFRLPVHITLLGFAIWFGLGFFMMAQLRRAAKRQADPHSTEG